jgi:hypothetical protein
MPLAAAWLFGLRVRNLIAAKGMSLAVCLALDSGKLSAMRRL